MSKRIVIRANDVNWKGRIYRIVTTDQIQDGDTVVVPTVQAKKYLTAMMVQHGKEERYYFVEQGRS